MTPNFYDCCFSLCGNWKIEGSLWEANFSNIFAETVISAPSDFYYQQSSCTKTRREIIDLCYLVYVHM